MPVRLRYAALLGLVALTGCVATGLSSGPPWVLAATPEMITLRWYPDEVSDIQALQVADGHCAAIGGRADVQATEQNGSIKIVTYRCR
ncbi:MAG: hypothetical protein JO001_20655 [Alphaproteobacteria bacterium]|nr:hypothetical protein [Alphaproteobacteria bacterium]